MKKYSLLLALVLPTVVFGAVEPRNYYGKVARRFSDQLSKSHVLQKRMDDSISAKAWSNMVTSLDYDHSFFLQSDLDLFSTHLLTIDDELKAGDVRFGFEVYGLFITRLHERIGFITNLLHEAVFDFSVDEQYRLKRKDAPWPKTQAEAEDHWRKRLKNDVLLQYVHCFTNSSAAVEGELPPVTNITENLIKKYRQYAITMAEMKDDQVLQYFLSAVARSYDPHSDYMSPTSKEDFDMEMNLSFCGIGAVLQFDDGALKIVEIMPGSPVERDGRIQEGDRIIGVKQEDGEMEDVMWKSMNNTIRKIRGPKGSRVTLQILPVTDPTGATKKDIELVRDVIKLEDQAATGHVECVVLNGFTNHVGYIRLPGFYGTMDKRPGDAGYRSSSMDVARIIGEQNAEDVDLFVLDLRGNGGGSLLEAVQLSALFVREGPVVQIKDVFRTMVLPIPPGNAVACDKPLIVLIDRSSASASEIVACHLQDTGRAIVIGDTRSHGKGTVQTVMGLGPEKYGSLKVTTARFYRIDGRSTQVEGGHSDIILSSLLDSLDIGEDKLPNALPFSRIMPSDYDLAWNLDQYVPELSKRADARLKDDKEWQEHLHNVGGMKELAEREWVPLELNARIALNERDRKLRELDTEELEEVDDELAEVSAPAEKEDQKGGVASARSGRQKNNSSRDLVLKRALDIAADLIQLNNGATYRRK